MEPARTIITLLGGAEKAAAAAGVAYTSPYRWMAAREKGGTGGVIPHWHAEKILEYARANGIALTAANFAPVVSESNVEQTPATETGEAA